MSCDAKWLRCACAPIETILPGTKLALDRLHPFPCFLSLLEICYVHDILTRRVPQAYIREAGDTLREARSQKVYMHGAHRPIDTHITCIDSHGFNTKSEHHMKPSPDRSIWVVAPIGRCWSCLYNYVMVYRWLLGWRGFRPPSAMHSIATNTCTHRMEAKEDIRWTWPPPHPGGKLAPRWDFRRVACGAIFGIVLGHVTPYLLS